MKLNLIMLTLILSLENCGFQKLAIDEIAIAGLRNKQSEIVEAAKFSIGLTYNSNLRYFHSSGVKDDEMRKNIEALGSNVFVKYQRENDPASMPDSIVIFSSIQSIGTIEIIFDFATNERDITGLVTKEKGSRIEKVGERTYYRRSPESM